MDWDSLSETLYARMTDLKVVQICFLHLINALTPNLVMKIGNGGAPTKSFTTCADPENNFLGVGGVQSPRRGLTADGKFQHGKN